MSVVLFRPSCVFLGLRLRALSSLYSFIRIERLAGVSSSEEDDPADLGRFSFVPFDLSFVPKSISESEVTDENEFVDCILRRVALAGGFRRPFRLSALDDVV